MNKRLIPYIATVGLLAGLHFGSQREAPKVEQTPAGEIKEPELYDFKTEKKVNLANIDLKPQIEQFVFREGPVYSNSQVPPNMCSRYVRKAGEDLFGKEYPSADAWELRDFLGIDEMKVGSFENLKDLEMNGRLKPGMILGVHNPKSKYNQRAQQTGAGYTHVMIYLGKQDGRMYFADKFGPNTRTKVSLEDIAKSNLEPIEILYSNN